VQGILDLASWAGQQVSNFVNRIQGKVEDDYDVDSPSKVWAKTGKDLGEGLLMGFADVLKDPDAILSPLFSLIQSANSQAPAGPAMMRGGAGTTIDGRTIQIEVNPTYARTQSQASLYYDVVAALQAARM
jgi:hypothetical protein